MSYFYFMDNTEFQQINLKVVEVFEVLQAEFMKRPVFWDITSCSPLKVYLRFGRACCLRLQVRQISQTKDQRERLAIYFLIGLFLVLFFDSAHGNYTFFRSVGLTFKALHRVASHNTEFFISKVNDVDVLRIMAFKQEVCKP
jgi:hypothetical protein